MPKNVTAVRGDCLCSIAIAAGFLDCAKLRAQAENAKFLVAGVKAGDVVRLPDLEPKDAAGSVEKLHKYRRRKAPAVSIRFVHGSRDKRYRDDTTLTLLNVSKFVTDKGGMDGTDPFPPGFGFDDDGHADDDAFKVEVVDPKAAGPVKVKLEALRPTFKPDGSLDGHVPFAGMADANKRAIPDLECQAVNADNIAFRSRYLRLVVDHPDFDAVSVSKQALLTRDLIFDGDEKVEILDQLVRATYVVDRCPGTGGAKCQTVAEASVGAHRQRVRMQLHVLQDPATGAPTATEDDARKALLSKMRRGYAQVGLGVNLLGIRQVPAPTNLIAVADAGGGKAEGGKTISVQVQIKTKDAVTTVFDQTISIVTNAKAKPIATATALAAAINNAFDAAVPPLADRAVASDNPPLVGQTIGSADVLVSDPFTRTIRLVIVTSGDARHPVTIGRIVGTAVTEFDGTNQHVGTIEERVLVKNYDTGTDRVDSFVVGGLAPLPGSFGEAFTPSQSSKKARRPFARMRNTLIINKGVASAVDFERATIPHEVGHILMDVVHALVDTELMRRGDGIADDRPPGGRKRISARPIKFDEPKIAAIPSVFVRKRNAKLLDRW